MWANFADPLDLVTLDITLADDSGGSPQLIDATANNLPPTTMPPAGTSACGKCGNRGRCTLCDSCRCAVVRRLDQDLT
jgi:hypothetical protein